MTARFFVNGWSLDNDTVSLAYECDGHSFRETLAFPFPVAVSPVVGRLLDLLSVVAGVSYAKAFAPATVHFPTLDVSPSALTLIEHTYDHGMREFAFRNGMKLPSPFVLADGPRGIAHAPRDMGDTQRPLIPFGAGRDSCVVTSALAHLNPTLFTVGENPHARRIASVCGLEHLSVVRTIDAALLQLNDSGAPNGHVPVTGINSLVSVIVAELTGCTSVGMANEKSASRPTRVVDGIEINHQYSKSLGYEMLMAAAIRDTGSAVGYGSVLRTATDSDISRAFAVRCERLHHDFMSCNRAMIRDASKRSNGWCNDCPKCRGVFLSLAPFLAPDRMVSIFGADLLADANQVDGFRELLTDSEKPFECVADVEEARLSLRSLGQQPEWAQHAVVRTLLQLADSVPTNTTDEATGNMLFADEINAFLRGAE
jgi:hypothetical protein